MTRYRTGRPPGKPPMPKSDLIPTPGQKGLERASSRATKEAKERFLVALAECGSIAGAARACGRAKRTVHEWRDRDPEFCARWDDALQRGVATLEVEAWRRAVEGTERPVVSAGKVVATVREYSDSLLALLLRAHAPEKYGPKAGLTVGMQTHGPAEFTFRFDGDGLGPLDRNGPAQLEAKPKRERESGGE